MPDSELPIDYVDYTSLSFPSDNVTLGHLRKVYAHRLDVEGGVREFFVANARNPKGPKEDWLFCMLSAERYLARHAYEEALGKTWTCLTKLGDTRDESAKELSEFYVHFGLASGPIHAEQLIRSFEAQAAAQAKFSEGLSGPSGL